MEEVTDSVRIADATKMEQIRNRLKKEKGEDQQSWWELGKQEGLNAAAGMHYTELKALVEENEVLQKAMRQNVIQLCPWNYLPEEVKDEIDDDIRHDGPDSRYAGIDRDSYALGYLEGVEELWGKVEGMLGSTETHTHWGKVGGENI